MPGSLRCTRSGWRLSIGCDLRWSSHRHDELVRLRVTLSADVDRDSIVESLASEGIPTRTYFPPLHLQPYIRERYGTREGMLPITEDISRRTLALPFHNTLKEEQVERVVRALVHTVTS